jgi:hypothetical protein
LSNKDAERDEMNEERHDIEDQEQFITDEEEQEEVDEGVE